ncbi:hypothetical protein M2J84_05480 [Comamonas aquatica]|uniref:hypothetical protein n=1 Tax=Comamonas aquatica TaxID=225991 RepID=UPI0022DCFAA8|nr:hypothetical protein [Comamonas aquatica]WBM43087.1 hypothetical protein M2J84_05480 [Comamonas aquatica]
MNALPNVAPYPAAVKFFEAAQILERQEGDFLEVIVMQYAFAAELCFKCFSIEKSPVPKVSEDADQLLEDVRVSEDVDKLLEDVRVSIPKSGRGHNLKVLFADKLQASVQEKLSKFFYEETGADLRRLTETCANCFEDSRYWFERCGVLPIDDVRTLARGLIRCVARHADEIGEATR